MTRQDLINQIRQLLQEFDPSYQVRTYPGSGRWRMIHQDKQTKLSFYIKDLRFHTWEQLND